MRIRKATLQFVFVKPITSILQIVLDHHGLCEEGDYSLKRGYFWISLVNNMSVSLALYGLVLFYIATQERLAPFQPFYKFLCVKSILFFSYWQGFAFTLL